MNFKMVFNVIGRICQTAGALLIIPALVAVIYLEIPQLMAFLLVAAISFGLGSLITLICKTKNHIIYAKEGFAIVAAAWIVTSINGAVPFVLTREIPSFIDAFFESVSGFTTTGASILDDVEAMSKSMLFWRSFTHWVGGMGVLVFIMALLPNITERSMHIMRAEMPGPVVGKLVPRAKDTAKILYLIYIVLTVLEVVLLWLGDMNLYESFVHAFGTAGTGGFGIKGDSIGSYSPYSQWVITVFMLLFGVNFNLYFLILIKKFKSVLKSTELWCYMGIVAVSTGIITLNILSINGTFEKSVREAAFQVASIVTTTGYATTDFNLWPNLSRSIIFILMFSGACAGSTCGGLKITRTVTLIKSMGREFKRMLHPRSVSTVVSEGKSLNESEISGVNVYFSLYIICIAATFLAISLDGNPSLNFETNLTAAVSCFNNVGPGLAGVGPASSYAAYSGFSKVILSLAMLLGRLEIYPLLIAVVPSVWTKRKKA